MDAEHPLLPSSSNKTVAMSPGARDLYTVNCGEEHVSLTLSNFWHTSLSSRTVDRAAANRVTAVCREPGNGATRAC